MPLDTAAKRFSINGSRIVRPDGTIDAADRATIAGFYLIPAAPVTTRRIRTSSSEPRGLSTTSRHGTGSTSSTEPRGLVTSSTTEGA